MEYLGELLFVLLQKLLGKFELKLKYKIKRKKYFIIESNLLYAHIHVSVIFYGISLDWGLLFQGYVDFLF